MLEGWFAIFVGEVILVSDLHVGDDLRFFAGGGDGSSL
jgi:hypothetical protein